MLRKLQLLAIMGIILFHHCTEIIGNESKKKHNVSSNTEPEIENPEYITNGKNVVGPEVVYVGKHFQI